MIWFWHAKERCDMKKAEGPETQFDFWLGEWDCTWGDDGAGRNRVERILDGTNPSTPKKRGAIC